MRIIEYDIERIDEDFVQFWEPNDHAHFCNHLRNILRAYLHEHPYDDYHQAMCGMFLNVLQSTTQICQETYKVL